MDSTDGMAPRPDEQPVSRRRAGIAVLLAVLIFGSAGSVALMYGMERIQQRFAAQLMDQNASNVSHAVEDEAARYSETLSDLAAAAGARSSFTANDFNAITGRLNRQRLPGASGVAFVVSTTESQIPAVQAYWRDQGAAGLRLSPVDGQAEHVFAVFNRSLDNTAPITGRDLSQAPEPLEALQLARTNGMVAASPTYVLLKDRELPSAQQRQLSFTLTVPVYGGIGTPDVGGFRGWILMGMRGGDFIKETLMTRAGDDVWIALDDISSTVPITVSATAGLTRTGDVSLARIRAITVGQRTWQVRIQPTDRLLNPIDRYRPLLAGGACLLLTGVTGVFAHSRRRALIKFDEATAALRSDIERRKGAEARMRQRELELRHLNLHDPLTSLANRTMFDQRLEHAMATHPRTTGTLGVLFIDLDGFKAVNDELGHSAGDAVLLQAADRLRECARESDTVARFGGDEFAILSEQLAAPEDIGIVADRVVAAMQAPFDVSGRMAAISCSVGAALQMADDQLPDDLLRSADEAMYAAKAAGKNRFRLAGPVVPATSRPTVARRAELRNDEPVAR
jgi:diguanylate cyclase (GGDEF)-like protein